MICGKCAKRKHRKCKNGPWQIGTWCACQHRVKNKRKMKVKECVCGFGWVIGKKKVYGPIYQGHTPVFTRRKDWSDYYEDCYRYLCE